jgi:hypothetical protein
MQERHHHQGEEKDRVMANGRKLGHSMVAGKKKAMAQKKKSQQRMKAARQANVNKAGGPQARKKKVQSAARSAGREGLASAAQSALRNKKR